MQNLVTRRIPRSQIIVIETFSRLHKKMASFFDFARGLEELQFIFILSKIMIVTGVIVVVSLIFLKAEYGRYFSSNSTRKYGFAVDARVAWFVQELPAFVVPCLLLLYARKDVFGLTPNMILLSLFLLHYTQRLACPIYVPTAMFLSTDDIPWPRRQPAVINI